MQKFGGPYSLELIDLEGDHFNLKWKTENNFFIFKINISDQSETEKIIT